ncbi:hypothetical protein [Actinomadura fibrosa]|uniref:Uncharacterized protein n=1 Tax=Actinomadura fibrosa TaxID=111802 RepID=A0ABW2XX53_9ACTN|nr:hypothetical protein [Actinomadura fibrosa]
MTDLDALEERRLTELKQIVAARAAATPPRRSRSRIRASVGTWAPTWGVAGHLRPRLWVAASAVAVAAVTATLVTSLGGTDPAYAVTKHTDGTVDIDIRDFHDADALSRQLSKLGVPARVFYIEGPYLCRQPYAYKIDDIPKGLYSQPIDVPGDPELMRLQINTRLMRPGQYFVFVLTVTRHQGGTDQGVGEYLVAGRLIPCRFYPAPTPARPPGLPKNVVVGGPIGDILFAGD